MIRCHRIPLHRTTHPTLETAFALSATITVVLFSLIAPLHIIAQTTI